MIMIIMIIINNNNNNNNSSSSTITTHHLRHHQNLEHAVHGLGPPEYASLLPECYFSLEPVHLLTQHGREFINHGLEGTDKGLGFSFQE
jgi:hypothetical protein